MTDVGEVPGVGPGLSSPSPRVMVPIWGPQTASRKPRKSRMVASPSSGSERAPPGTGRGYSTSDETNARLSRIRTCLAVQTERVLRAGSGPGRTAGPRRHSVSARDFAQAMEGEEIMTCGATRSFGTLKKVPPRVLYAAGSWTMTFFSAQVTRLAALPAKRQSPTCVWLVPGWPRLSGPEFPCFLGPTRWSRKARYVG